MSRPTASFSRRWLFCATALLPLAISSESFAQKSKKFALPKIKIPNGSLNISADKVKLSLNRATYDIKGWAKDTTGGKGGRILRVTNLNNQGPGSLREAVEASGPRIVVFEVGGVIDLNSVALSIRNPHLTIAGQTAPSPGITLIRGETNIFNTHNVIIQHLFFRSGEAGHAKKSGKSFDSLSSLGSYNVIVDHCSLSWGPDENLSASGKRFTGDTVEEWRQGTSRQITYSNNLIYESPANSTHEKGEHSKGGLMHDNTTGILLYGNLYASNGERNALFKGGAWAAQVNNVIYNPGVKAIHYNLIAHEWTGRPYATGKVTLIGNVMRHGPDSNEDLPLFMFGGAGDLELYMRDNIAVDQWGEDVEQLGRYATASAKLITTKAPYLPADIIILPANEIEHQIYLTAGARTWDRDPIDNKLLSDVAEGRGEIIDSEAENTYGYPKYPTTFRPFVETDWNLNDMSPIKGWDSLFAVKTSKLT